MSQIQLIQGSEAWHEFRRSHIGSSDAPILMGVSPYKSIEQLLKEKITGESTQVEHAGMKRGKDLEPLVLSMLNAKLSCAMEPAVFEHDDYSFLSASLDGFDSVLNVICEIKCPNALDHKLATQGKVPEKYIPQLQHAMLVTGLNHIVYCSYSKGEIVIVNVEADINYQNLLLEQCIKFHASMKEGKLAADFDATEDRPDIDSLYQLYADMKDKVKFYEEQAEEAKKALIDAVGYRSILTRCVKIKEVKRSSYDYAKMCDDYQIDKEPYKKTSSYWDIRERKNEN